MTFQPGDMVRCERIPGGKLVVGRVYTVCRSDRGMFGATVHLAEVPDGCSSGWYDDRFELVPDDDSVFERKVRCSQRRHSTAYPRGAVYAAIDAERRRQDAKFGPMGALPAYDAYKRLSVLTEEVGEVAQALNDGDFAHAREELVQVAAVAVAWLEQLTANGDAS